MLTCVLKVLSERNIHILVFKKEGFFFLPENSLPTSPLSVGNWFVDFQKV